MKALNKLKIATIISAMLCAPAVMAEDFSFTDDYELKQDQQVETKQDKSEVQTQATEVQAPTAPSESYEVAEPQVGEKFVELTKVTEYSSKLIPTSIYDYVSGVSKTNNYKVVWSLPDLGVTGESTNFTDEFYTSKDHNWKEKVAFAVKDYNVLTQRISNTTQAQAYDCDPATILVSQPVERVMNKLGLSNCKVISLQAKVKYLLPSGKEYKPGMKIEEDDLLTPEEKAKRDYQEAEKASAK